MSYVGSYKNANLFVCDVIGPEGERGIRYSKNSLGKFKDYMIWHLRSFECDPTIGGIYEALMDEVPQAELHEILIDYKEGKI